MDGTKGSVKHYTLFIVEKINPMTVTLKTMNGSVSRLTKYLGVYEPFPGSRTVCVPTILKSTKGTIMFQYMYFASSYIKIPGVEGEEGAEVGVKTEYEIVKPSRTPCGATQKKEKPCVR